MIDKRRELNDVEQGQLADMIASAGYMSVIETLASMAGADADGANEDEVLTQRERERCFTLADQLTGIAA